MLSQEGRAEKRIRLSAPRIFQIAGPGRRGPDVRIVTRHAMKHNHSVSLVGQPKEIDATP